MEVEPWLRLPKLTLRSRRHRTVLEQAEPEPVEPEPRQNQPRWKSVPEEEAEVAPEDCSQPRQIGSLGTLPT